MSRVFVPQMPVVRGVPQDITDASRFGELIVVFHPQDPHHRHGAYADNIDERMPGLMEHARMLLASFNAKTDFLALTGSPLYLAICTMVLARLAKPIQTLRYDRLERAYYPVTINP